MDCIKTRFLILSDTHGQVFTPERHPKVQVDVAIHCGDLTEGSKLAEFQTSLNLLSSLDAPLKLVIAGNHDFTMDIPTFIRKVHEARPPLERDLVVKEYGAWGEVKDMFEKAKNKGIVFLDEGTREFVLQNGALLKVFASPFTPSLGDWGFQYYPQTGRVYDIQDGTDIVITHGPPKGIMDLTNSKTRAGCPDLFAAVARKRPRLHCFGHIHEGWGAKLVAWREKPSEIPNHFSDIDNDKSTPIAKLSKFSAPNSNGHMAQGRASQPRDEAESQSYFTSHCSSDKNPLGLRKHTLFVNAAVQGNGEELTQHPWRVDIELPIARL